MYPMAPSINYSFEHADEGVLQGAGGIYEEDIESEPNTGLKCISKG
jgi:hypothetical protein